MSNPFLLNDYEKEQVRKAILKWPMSYDPKEWFSENEANEQYSAHGRSHPKDWKQEDFDAVKRCG